MDPSLETLSKVVYIELELAIDIYSLVFGNTRFYLEQQYRIEIDNKDIGMLYGKSLEQGIKDLLTKELSNTDQSYDIDQDTSQIMEIFKKNSKSLKPTVPSVHIINSLRKDSSVKIVFFTYFIKESVQNLLDKIFTDLADEIVHVNELIEGNPFKSTEMSLILCGGPIHMSKFEELADNKQVFGVHVRQPKGEQYTSETTSIYTNLQEVPYEQYHLLKLTPCYEGSLFKVDFRKELGTAELAFWKASIPIEKVIIQGEVIHGWKRGSKDLGVPTSNIEMTAENKEKINDLLPGVYGGTVQFITYKTNEEELLKKYGEDFKNKKLKTALSIGYNPSYDNKERAIESFILDEYENDFYGEVLKIEITHYIRAESNYTAFDHLIMAIHNDIETTKHTVSIE